MPVVCTLYVIVIKHSNETLNNASYDFTIGTWLVLSLVFQLIGFGSFFGAEGSFDWTLWINGTIASFFNLCGCVFAISSFATGEPIGPISALICTQTILVVVITAFIEMKVPSVMELIGLVFGLFGAMLLTIPDELYALWFRLTRCRPYRSPRLAGTKDVSNSSEL